MINRHLMLNFKRPVSVLSRSFQLSSGKCSSVIRSHQIPKSLNFTDPAVSFNNKSSFELLRSVAVFSICQIRPLVKRSDQLLKISYRILGQEITNYVLKLSFFNHFCAGEDEVRIKPTVDYLHSNGIGSILDYAAEADIGSNETDTSVVEKRLKTDCLQARVYDYEGENLCDLHAETFKKCILAVHKVSPTGFAAIKCTALGNPILLEEMSTAIVRWREQFRKLDSDKKGYVTREQFADAYKDYFVNEINGGGYERNDKLADVIFDKYDLDHNGTIDYIEWMDSLHLCGTGSSRGLDPFLQCVGNADEMELLSERVHRLAQLASDLGVRLMIDAEHTYFQPAIDSITTDLIRKYNRDYPVIFSTYQMYLKDSTDRLLIDVERAKKGNFCFAAKLVRGAYMVLEKARAVEMNYDDPIHDSLSTTHDSYNAAVKVLISGIAAGQRVEVMIATHNKHSVELALEAMKENNLAPQSNVYFGQLLGMSDSITFTLGNAGYKAYKYVPYGKVQEVMPYLIRRAQENSDALGGAKEELQMMTTELKRRFLNSFVRN